MDKNHAKMDKVSCTILAAFILMSGTHFCYRYDVGALVDTMFQKVSAETYLPETSPTTQVALAAPTANDSSEEPLTTVTKSIARNPFAVPAGAMPIRHSNQKYLQPLVLLYYRALFKVAVRVWQLLNTWEPVKLIVWVKKLAVILWKVLVLDRYLLVVSK